MSEWKETTLDEIALINPTERLEKGSLAKKISMDVLNPFEKRIAGFSLEEYTGGMKFRNGDTIMARITPCLENGKTAFVDVLDNNEVGFGSTEYIVFREKEGLSDKHFLYYFSISPVFRDVAILSMTGSSGRQRVQTEVVRNHIFEFPLLEEQKAIAAVLSSLDDKIDLLNRQNKTLETMAETLFRQWFIEEAKADWEEVKLKDVCAIINGFAFKSEDYRPYGRAIIRTMNFKKGFIELNNLVYISSENELSYEKYLLKRYDFLLVMVGASLGNFAIVTSEILPALQNQNMWNFRTLGKISQHYLNFALREIITQNLANASGSAREYFQKSQFYEITIKIPEKNKIHKFDDIVGNSFLKIEINRRQIKTLSKLRDTLLPKLMNGEIKISL